MRKYLSCFCKELRVFCSYMFPFVFFSLFISALFTPGYRSARYHSRKRACFANQKTIMAALEMYNLDYDKEQKEGLIIRGQKELQILVKEKYLQSEPKCPEITQKKLLPNWYKLHAISYLSIPAGIYTLSSSLTKAAGKKLKQIFYPVRKNPLEYRTDSCGNVWCTVHGPVEELCLPCSDKECEKALQNATKK